MAFAVVAVADEGGIQTDADRRLRRRRLGQGRVAKLLADFQRMMAKCFRARAGLASRPGDCRVRSAISRWLAACLLKSSITISACWPRSRKYSAIVKPANGAIHCNPAADARTLLADGDVDAKDVARPLIDDRIDRDRTLADGAVADDQFALPAPQSQQCIDDDQSGLDRLDHEIPVDDFRRRALDRLHRRRGDGSF